MMESPFWMIVPGNAALSALVWFVIAMPFLYAARKPVHELLHAVGRAWETEATPFGPRQRWLATCRRLRDEGHAVLDGPARWGRGELTVPWPLFSC